MFVWVFVCVFVCCLFVCLCVCLFVCLFGCLSVCPSVCLFVCVSFCFLACLLGPSLARFGLVPIRKAALFPQWLRLLVTFQKNQIIISTQCRYHGIHFLTTFGYGAFGVFSRIPAELTQWTFAKFKPKGTRKMLFGLKGKRKILFRAKALGDKSA